MRAKPRGDNPAGGGVDRGDHVQSGSDGTVRWWRVGHDRVELTGAGSAWTARVIRHGWAGALDLDGVFDDEARALRWCRRMAAVLERDLRDEPGPAQGG